MTGIYYFSIDYFSKKLQPDIIASREITKRLYHKYRVVILSLSKDLFKCHYRAFRQAQRDKF